MRNGIDRKGDLVFMKKCVLYGILFIMLTAALSAQTSADVIMYVPTVAGIGSSLRDNDTFREYMVTALRKWNLVLADTAEGADYFLQGTLTDDPLGTPESYAFTLALQNRNSLDIYARTIQYETPEESEKDIIAMLSMVLFNYARVSANAQNAALYVAPVRGSGSARQDNAVLRNTIYRELWGYDVDLMHDQKEAHYLVQTNLAKAGKDYAITLHLQNKDGASLDRQTRQYQTTDEAHNVLPAMVFAMLYKVFAPLSEGEAIDPAMVMLPRPKPNERVVLAQPGETIDPAEEWRHKPLYFGGSLFWAPRLYSGERVSVNIANIGVGFSGEYNFLQYVSLGIGLDFLQDWVMVTTGYGDDYRNWYMQIPVTLGGVLRPGDKFMHKPYAGIVCNIPLVQHNISPILSWIIGFQYGLKAGPGIVFTDLSFSADIGKSDVNVLQNDPRQYSRYMLYLGVGYKWGTGKNKAQQSAIIIEEGAGAEQADGFGGIYR